MSCFCRSALFPWLSEVCTWWQTSRCPWGGLLQTDLSQCICYWLFGNMSVTSHCLRKMKTEVLVTYKPWSGQHIIMKARLWLHQTQIQTFIIKQTQKLSQPILCPFRYSNKYLTRNHSLEVYVLVFHLQDWALGWLLSGHTVSIILLNIGGLSVGYAVGGCPYKLLPTSEYFGE